MLLWPSRPNRYCSEHHEANANKQHAFHNSSTLTANTVFYSCSCPSTPPSPTTIFGSRLSLGAVVVCSGVSCITVLYIFGKYLRHDALLNSSAKTIEKILVTMTLIYIIIIYIYIYSCSISKRVNIHIRDKGSEGCAYMGGQGGGRFFSM